MKLFVSALAGAAAIAAAPASAVSLNGNDFSGAANVEGSSTLGPSSTNATEVIFTGNSDRTGLHNVTYTGDNTFSGQLRATPSDNDTLGLVFGYVDGDNNYRLGWEGGGDWDFEVDGPSGSGNNGLWLAAETGGSAVSLFANTSLFWATGVTYDFSVTMAGGNISFEIKNGATVLESQTVAATRSTDGLLGVYANSQSGVFSNMDVSPAGGAAPIPLPATGVLLLGALGGLGIASRRKKSKTAA